MSAGTALTLVEFWEALPARKWMIFAPALPLPELPPALAARRLLEHIELVELIFGRLPRMG